MDTAKAVVANLASPDPAVGKLVQEGRLALKHKITVRPHRYLAGWKGIVKDHIDASPLNRLS